MNPPNYEVIGAGNPAPMPLALLRRLIERATSEPGEIRPFGRIRFGFHHEESCAGMAFPCEWLAAGVSRRLALIRNPYPTTELGEGFLLCLADGRIFAKAANAALARLIALTLDGQIKTAAFL